MATKLQLGYVPITTGLDITIRDSEGLVWNNTTELYETWADANLAQYVVPATYVEGNLYLVQWPLTMLTSSEYMYLITLRAVAGAPALDDHYMGSGTIGWNKEDQTLTGGVSGGDGVVNIVHDTTQIVNAQQG